MHKWHLFKIVRANAFICRNGTRGYIQTAIAVPLAMNVKLMMRTPHEAMEHNRHRTPLNMVLTSKQSQ